MGIQSVLCPVCQGVLPATGKESYTAARGRLIVTNGYCAGGCAEVADQGRQETQQQVQQQTQVMARPQSSPATGPVPAVGGGRAPLRVVR